MKEFLDDLTTRDQRMMFAVLTMVHTAVGRYRLGYAYKLLHIVIVLLEQ